MGEQETIALSVAEAAAWRELAAREGVSMAAMYDTIGEDMRTGALWVDDLVARAKLLAAARARRSPARDVFGPDHDQTAGG